MRAHIALGGGGFDCRNDRLLEFIGNIPPAEAKELYHAATDNIDMAA